MVVSRSYVIALPDDRRARLVMQVRDLAHDGMNTTTGLVPIRYVTHGYRARRPH
jgi:hypothetical protein